jgi:hypothetical protein
LAEQTAQIDALQHAMKIFGILGRFALTAGVAVVGAASANAQQEDWTARFQATYIYQSKPAFDAPYSGPKSLSAEHERSYTFSATAYLGARLWEGGELYFNPEAIQGVALSEVTGLGGFTNGEIQKVAGPTLKLYRARLFLRQTIGLGGGGEAVASDDNQLAGSVDRNRLVFTAGNLSVIDIFGLNEYAGDPRTQFLNWSFLTFGAFDYAADLRGYTWGAAAEYIHGDWTLRAGRFMQPKESNGMELNTDLRSSYGDQAEVERRHLLGGRPGKLKLLAYRNVAEMASFEDAIAYGQTNGVTPDIGAVRKRQAKVGWGASLEQAAGADVGIFARVSAHDGRTETYAFTEIDRSLSLGGVIKGTSWRRSQDAVGVAIARNGISSSHQAYLGAGGTTFFLGDGNLRYAPESIFEAYYSLRARKGVYASLDWQYIRNPAYNADRGPVQVSSVRLHVEF